jgi:hypothetical protein
MLKSVGEEIRECYVHAEDCARQAAAQSNAKLKQDFLDMERRWLALARSFEFSQSLSDFSNSRQPMVNAAKPSSKE